MNDKDRFIQRAQALDGAYFDYGRCLYLMSRQNGILDDVADYLFNSATSSYDLDEKVYELMGCPEPMPIVSDNKELHARQLIVA